MKKFNFVAKLSAHDLEISVFADTEEEAIEKAEFELLQSKNLLNCDASADVVSVNVENDEEVDEQFV